MKLTKSKNIDDKYLNLSLKTISLVIFSYFLLGSAFLRYIDYRFKINANILAQHMQQGKGYIIDSIADKQYAGNKIMLILMLAYGVSVLYFFNWKYRKEKEGDEHDKD